MKKFSLLLSAIILSIILMPRAAGAVCPVCVVAIGAGVGLCRWLGIDDVISGIWIGGLIVSVIIWTLNWLIKKQINFKARWLVLSVVFYLLIIPPLFWSGIMGHPLNKLWGIDKLLLGIIVGGLTLLVGVIFHNFLKMKHQGKSFFPYQKVAMPILLMLIVSFLFYYFAGCGFVEIN